MLNPRQYNEMRSKTMSDLIVLTFDSEDQAGRVREALRDLEHYGHLSLNDTAVIVKDAEGKVHVRNQVESGVKWGAVGGAVLGPLLMFMFPLAGIAVGAGLGALVGKLFGTGVDQKFVKDVSQRLAPGSSAIFFLVREGDAGTLRAAVEPYKGAVYQTTVSTELEDQLKDALKE
jgi:uncharacterized membrane protein